MRTESNHHYKGWDFTIVCATFKGIWSKIYRYVPNEKSPNGLKKLTIRQKGYNFYSVDKMIQETKNFIDNHEKSLIHSLEFQKAKHKII